MTTCKHATLAMTLLAASALAACAKPGPDSAKITADVTASVAQMIAGFNAHDVNKAVSQDAPDMIGMFHGAANTVGIDADRANTKAELSDPAAHLMVSNATVEVTKAGDMAIYRATYVYTLTDPKTKQPASEIGNWVIGYKPQPDGTWKMAWNIAADTGGKAP
jgi:ketosteroid isomerase-like protein